MKPNASVVRFSSITTMDITMKLAPLPLTTFAAALLVTAFATVGGFADTHPNTHHTPERLAEIQKLIDADR